MEKLKLPATIFDFTLPKKRELDYNFTEEDIVIVGTPVYAGRIPNVLLKFLSRINGGGALAIPVVTFGNRNYDDALIELRDILIEDNFRILAAGAFVGEHSFSKILGENRPNEIDLSLAETLAEKAAEKILSHSTFDNILKVKGTDSPYRPYFKPLDRFGSAISILKVKPKTNENCIDCKICVDLCPMGSINFDDVSKITGICIKCCACVKKCPQEAKFFDDAGYLEHLKDLEKTYKRAAVSEIFY